MTRQGSRPGSGRHTKEPLRHARWSYCQGEATRERVERAVRTTAAGVVQQIRDDLGQPDRVGADPDRAVGTVSPSGRGGAGTGRSVTTGSSPRPKADLAAGHLGRFGGLRARSRSSGRSAAASPMDSCSRSARARPSSIAWQVSWPRFGVIGWAASASRMTPPGPSAVQCPEPPPSPQPFDAEAGRQGGMREGGEGGVRPDDARADDDRLHRSACGRRCKRPLVDRLVGSIAAGVGKTAGEPPGSGRRGEPPGMPPGCHGTAGLTRSSPIGAVRRVLGSASGLRARASAGRRGRGVAASGRC